MNIQNTAAIRPAPAPLPSFFLESEAGFYGRYDWCLNPYQSIEEVIDHLRAEIGYLCSTEEPWQVKELATNIVFLACAISDAADDCLSGKRYDFTRKVPRVLRPMVAIPTRLLNLQQQFAQSRLDGLRRWRANWEDAVHRMLLIYVRPDAIRSEEYSAAGEDMLAKLDFEFPAQFLNWRINSPRAFRSQDYSSHDAAILAEKFCAQQANPQQPCLVVGMRTAGSYLGPLLRASLADKGYRDTDIVTLRPKSGVSPKDMQKLKDWADRGGVVAIIDEPVNKGGTLASCIRPLRKAGFAASSIYALFPVHPAARNWHRSDAAVAFKGCHLIPVQPEETFKAECLQPSKVEQTLLPYFEARGWRKVEVFEDKRSATLNQELARTSDKWFRTRLKQVFAVRLTAGDGATETRYVIAKSIGWGWAGYQAFFTAQSLQRFIPPVLGLRDGILYSEWVGSGSPAVDGADRPAIVRQLAEYVAARVKGLGFAEDPSPALGRARLQLGMDMLVELLFSVYRSSRLAFLKHQWIREKLTLLSTPSAALLDGKMQVAEWIQTDTGLLKTDYEQHGMGRMDFSVTDPAYDLSAAILSFELSQEEETDLLSHYAELTGDTGIGERMPLYKLMAGRAVMDSTYELLGHEGLTARHAELNRAYIDAWTFSMVQTARFCASHIPRTGAAFRDAPLVFCDVDGVIDQQVFKFPATTPSGIRAMSLLTGHGLPVYLNTARSAHDVIEYCAAYGLKGGVAETGSYIWDATTGRGKVLVDPETLAELKRVREALERIPGVFINHFYNYSIKVHSFREGRAVALPRTLLNRVLAETGAVTLTLHQTYTDSIITSQAVDKGTGLLAMCDFVGKKGVETIAVGDTAPDLTMFSVADRSYAPGHTPVRELATMLGCRVVPGKFQHGFLQIASDIVHPDGATCEHCEAAAPPLTEQGKLLMHLLGEVEKSKGQRVRDLMHDLRSLPSFLKAYAHASR